MINLQPKSVDQLVAIASAIDNAEADILMVVGGDGTIAKVFTVIISTVSTYLFIFRLFLDSLKGIASG